MISPSETKFEKVTPATPARSSRYPASEVAATNKTLITVIT